MRKFVAAFCLLGALVAVLSCDRGPAPPLPAQRKVIVASVYPLADMVAQHVDPWATIITLLPEGEAAETYELTDEQKQQIATADMVVLAGSGIDAWAVAAQRELSPRNQRLLVMVDMVDLYAPPGGLRHPEAPTAAERVGWSHPWLDPMSQDVFLARVSKPLHPMFDNNRQVSLRGRATLVRSNGLNYQQRAAARFANIRYRKCVSDTGAFDPVFAWAQVVPVARLEDLGLHPGEPMADDALAALRAEVLASTSPAVYVDRLWSEQEVAALREAAGVPVLRLNAYHPRKNVASFLELWFADLTTIYEAQRGLIE